MKLTDANQTQTALLYHDNSALQNIKSQANQQEALESVAGQFEAMFLQMVLRQMRTSSDALADPDSPFSSQQQGVFRDLHDGQLSVELAKKQQSGIAEMLVKQLSPAQQQKVAQMVEPSNDSLNNTSLDVAHRLNPEAQTVAYDKQQPLRNSYQQAMSTTAFQQPLINKIEFD